MIANIYMQVFVTSSLFVGERHPTEGFNQRAMILKGAKSARKDMVYELGFNRSGTKLVNAVVRRGRYKLIWENASIEKFKNGKDPDTDEEAYLYDLTG